MTDAITRYRADWQRSHHDRDAFWLRAATDIHWSAPPQRAIDDRGSTWTWFPDARLNVSFNAVDRHVLAGRGEDPALIFDSAMTRESRTITYRELLESVSRFAGALRAHGVNAGDRVVVYMPMIPEAVVAMLACARIGAVHSVVFGGFAGAELAARIRDAGATTVVTASGGLEPGKVVDYIPILQEALDLSGGDVRTVIVKDRAGFPTALPSSTGAGARWVDWDNAQEDAQPVGVVQVASQHPLYVLYTSGTTGNPKGIVRDSGGYAVALTWSMRNIYGIGPGDVFWAASDVGWVVGHSYIVYGPLLAGATSVMYEGKPVGTPDAGAFWRVIAENKVSVLFTAPTAIRAIHRVDPELDLLEQYDTTSLRALFLAGERLDPETYHWIGEGLQVPVVDHWWQTETGWAIAANPLGFGAVPPKAGSSSMPMVGYDVLILDSKGRPVPTGKEGNIVIRLPLPPGSTNEVWGDRRRFEDAYLSAFPGFYATGDSGYLDSDGYLFVMGRTDDVINVAGHRLSTGALEEVIALHQDVAECAVVGIRDALKGQRAMAFVTLKVGVATPEQQLHTQLVELVRTRIGPVAAFRDVLVLDRLPKTRSGKILRRTMRQIIDGEPFKTPATIEDVTVLDAIIASRSVSIAT
ncbi:acetate--CoA ligase [Microbacterium rhizomatis]|uniref:Propionyl-CoA synthetase n=1 Tax=Microbacterium rhizomatis TaxID=1631477 RepID=A0A5J5IVB6_9MICO|nr:acetate--CoA ligase [Microbacterium rhizomatis]KAA9104756.1 propionyl-CoA synthetase [Microbacterium rhizomatis]